MSHPQTGLKEPSDLTVPSLQSILERAQRLSESDASYSPWQKSIIKQSQTAQEHLQELLAKLKLSRVQFLFECMESPSGETEFTLNLWLRLIIVMSSTPSSPDHPEVSQERSKALFSQLRRHLVETIKLLNEFSTLSTKIKAVYGNYKKYIVKIYKSPASIVPIAEVVRLQPTSKGDVRSTPTSIFVNTSSDQGQSSLICRIRENILLEYINEKSEAFRIAIPTFDRADDTLILNSLISNLDTLVSNSKDEIPSTAKGVRSITPDLFLALTSLVDLLENHDRKDRIRATVLATRTKRHMATVEATFKTLSDVIPDIYTNLIRCVGISDYLSTRLSPRPGVVSPRSHPSRRRIRLPFIPRSKLKRFQEDAQVEAEAFLKKVICTDRKPRPSFNLHLPVTQELTALILRRAVTTKVTTPRPSELLPERDKPAVCETLTDAKDSIHKDMEIMETVQNRTASLDHPPNDKQNEDEKLP